MYSIKVKRLELFMNKRIRKIIDYLIKNNGVSNLNDLSNFMKVNKRTIRYDIKKINEIFYNNNLPEIKFSKKKILLKDYITLENIKINLLNYENDYRNILIILKIIFEQHLNITHMCDLLKISRNTIKNEISFFKKKLLDYDLKIISIPRKKGLFLIGKEENIRIVQLGLISEYSSIGNYDAYEREYFKEKINFFFINIDLVFIKKFLEMIIEKLEKIISDETEKILINYIMIMIFRIRNNKIIDEFQNEFFLKESSEYSILKEKIYILEKKFNININENEILKLSDYLLGCHNYNMDNYYYNNWIEIKILIKNIIKIFDNEMNSNLINDIELIDGLSNHIKPLIHRVRNKISLTYSILSDIKEEFFNVFEITKLSLKPLYDFIYMIPPEEEIAFVALHFISALKRTNIEKNNTKRVLIVCSLGYGTSKLLCQEIENKYDVNIVDIIPFNLLEKYNLNNIDLIITTLNESNIKFEIPIISVSPILNEENFKLIESYGIKDRNNKIIISDLLDCIKKGATIFDENKLINELTIFFKGRVITNLNIKEKKLSELLLDDQILLNYEATTWQDSLKQIGNLLTKQGYVLDTYTNNMIENINKHGAYMVINGNIIIPHAKNDNCVLKTGMALITLKNEIIFPGNKKVKIIFAFSSLDNKEHLNALTMFVEMTKNGLFSSKIIETKNDILNYIKKYEFIDNLRKNISN